MSCHILEFKLQESNPGPLGHETTVVQGKREKINENQEIPGSSPGLGNLKIEFVLLLGLDFAKAAFFYRNLGTLGSILQ